MAACFPELLRWVRELWTPDRDAPDAEPPLVLALVPTHHRDAWVALVAGVVYREHALPVAWHIVAAQARGLAHFGRLLHLRAPAVPPGTPVPVLHAPGHKEPWLLPAGTVTDRTDAALYACRHWIEQGFRACKRGRLAVAA